MAKLCGVDLRSAAFAPGAVAQTSAARINVIVINSVLNRTRLSHPLRSGVARVFQGRTNGCDAEFDGRALDRRLYEVQINVLTTLKQIMSTAVVAGHMYRFPSR
jgi:hypothetical protein